MLKSWIQAILGRDVGKGEGKKRTKDSSSSQHKASCRVSERRKLICHALGSNVDITASIPILRTYWQHIWPCALAVTLSVTVLWGCASHLTPNTFNLPHYLLEKQ